MKLKQLSMAVAAAALSSQALALAPNVTPQMEIFISGASAHTFDAAKIPGMTTNQTVLLHKRSKGGSGQGVQPVADAVAIDAMNINNGNCTETAAGSKDWRCTISNTGDLVQRVSHAGISDVEPALFVGLNVPEGAKPVTKAQLQELEVTSMNAVVFGIPVTTNLRNALQVAQGLTEGVDDEANMPSLSKGQVAGLMSGAIPDWGLVMVNGVPLTEVAGVTPPVAEGSEGFSLVHVCRRVPGSGTQAQMNAKFLNTPCAAGVSEPLRADASDADFGPVVVENSGSGDLTSCLNDKFTANNWAVGIQSLEKNADLDDDFRFIKIDGVAPTLENVASNKYFDWVETTMQWRKTNQKPAGDVLNILKVIAKNASSPANINSLNAGFDHPFAATPGAYLALSSNGHAPSIPFDGANPVAVSSHATSGKPNSCATPLVFDFNESEL